MIFVCLVVLVLLAPFGLGALCWWLWEKGPYGRGGAIALLCAVCCLLLVGYLRDRGVMDRNEALRKSLDVGLHTDLVIGDSPEKIERVLKKRNLECEYDAGLGGYVFQVPCERSDSRIVVEIKVDADRKLRAIHVKLFYVSL